MSKPSNATARHLAGAKLTSQLAGPRLTGLGSVETLAVRPGAEVGRVLLHPSASLAALQWVPAPGWAPAQEGEQRTAEALSAADALAAKQLLRATLLGVGETVHAAPAATAPHAPLHTSLAFWALQPGGCGPCPAAGPTLLWQSAGSADAVTHMPGASNQRALLAVLRDVLSFTLAARLLRSS